MTYIKRDQLKSINKKEIELKEFGLKEVVKYLIYCFAVITIIYMVVKSGVVHSEYDMLYRFAASLEDSFPFLEKLYQFVFM